MNDQLDDINFKISNFTGLVLEYIPVISQVDVAYRDIGLNLIEYNTKIKEWPKKDDNDINTCDKNIGAEVILGNGN